MSAKQLCDVPAPGLWAREGACRGGEVNMWFPRRGEFAHPARRICLACPVLVQCRRYGLEYPGLHGIWGGLSGDDRRRIRNAKDAAA